VIALEADDVHVWDATVAEVRAVGPGLERSLSDAERRRAARFRFPEHREAFVARRALLRALVGAYSRLDPSAVELDETCSHCGGDHGKPRLAGRPELGFSLSHSGGRVLCAFALESEIGVDIERVEPEADWDGPARLTLSSDERAELDAMPAEARARRFYALWTRKEALAKATGYGLALPLREIDIAADGTVRGLPSAAGQPRAWALRDLDVGDPFAAALAVRMPTVRVRRMNVRELPAGMAA
jgi:4'-phosphopantetheinyl transferase